MLSKTLTRSNFIHILAMLILFASTGFFNYQFRAPLINVSKQDSAVNFNNNFLRFINIGNKRLFTAILWIQTLIESDIEHYKENKLNNWMYLRFDSILTLEPKFLEAYRFGGVYLSIVKDDLKGASDIYERGLQIYPEDYQLNFNAGFHFFYEVGDEERSFPLFSKIAFHHQAPPYLPSIVSKMRANRGDIQAAYQMMLEAYNRAPDGSFIKKRFHSSLYAIKAEIDLKCLNEIKKGCSKYDFDNQKYLLQKDGTFTASLKWQPFRIKTPRK